MRVSFVLALRPPQVLAPRCRDRGLICLTRIPDRKNGDVMPFR